MNSSKRNSDWIWMTRIPYISSKISSMKVLVHCFLKWLRQSIGGLSIGVSRIFSSAFHGLLVIMVWQQVSLVISFLELRLFASSMTLYLILGSKIVITFSFHEKFFVITGPDFACNIFIKVYEHLFVSSYMIPTSAVGELHFIVCNFFNITCEKESIILTLLFSLMHEAD